MKFVTNAFKSGKGFKAFFQQIPCNNYPNLDDSIIHGIHDVTSSSHHSSSSSSSNFGANRFGSSSIVDPNPIPAPPSSPPTLPPIESSDDTRIGAQLIKVGGISRIPCDLIIYDQMFELMSSGYPITNYPINSDCLYSIRRINNQICSLQLNFVEFDLEQSSKNCEFDYLEIGSSNNRLCGRMSNQTLSEYTFI